MLGYDCAPRSIDNLWGNTTGTNLCRPGAVGAEFTYYFGVDKERDVAFEDVTLNLKNVGIAATVKRNWDKPDFIESVGVNRVPEYTYCRGNKDIDCKERPHENYVYMGDNGPSKASEIIATNVISKFVNQSLDVASRGQANRKRLYESLRYAYEAI